MRPALEAHAVWPALRPGCALSHCWFLRGYVSEGRAALDRPLARPDMEEHADALDNLALIRLLPGGGPRRSATGAGERPDLGTATSCRRERASVQVPWGVEALGDTISRPTWKTKPSWYLLPPMTG
jgi:hypothetical protein